MRIQSEKEKENHLCIQLISVGITVASQCFLYNPLFAQATVETTFHNLTKNVCSQQGSCAFCYLLDTICNSQAIHTIPESEPATWKHFAIMRKLEYLKTKITSFHKTWLASDVLFAKEASIFSLACFLVFYCLYSFTIWVMPTKGVALQSCAPIVCSIWCRKENPHWISNCFHKMHQPTKKIDERKENVKELFPKSWGYTQDNDLIGIFLSFFMAVSTNKQISHHMYFHSRLSRIY